MRDASPRLSRALRCAHVADTRNLHGSYILVASCENDVTCGYAPVMFSTKPLATRVAGGSGGIISVSRAFQLLGVRTLRVSTPARDIRTDGGGEAEDFIERSLDQASKQGAKKRDLTPGEVLTTKREALSLYRAVWRASFMFVWKNERGVEWKEVIRESARKEFEAARHEREPEMVARLLLGGRDCLNQTMQKFAVKQDSLMRGGQPADAGAGSSGAPGGGSGTGWPGAQG